MTEQHSDRILRRADIEALTGFTERQIRIMEAKGDFPRRFRLSPQGRAVGWSEREVQAWIRECMASRGPQE